MKYLLLFCFLLGVCAAHAVTFREFSGACQGGDMTSPYWDGLAGWNRFDISWSAAEPEEGAYDDAYLKRMYARVRQNLDRGVKILPVLCYAPGWASRRGEYEFTAGNVRKLYTPLSGNEYLLREYKKQNDGSWELKADKDGNTERKVRNPRIPLAPESVAKWRKFIRRVVSDLRAEPYGLEYFQIWNEAHPKSGFYDGGMADYFSDVHLPAAEEIRALGGKAVYGGYPCCGTVSALADDLTKAKAWDSIDVIDIHYFPEWCMEYLRRRAAENGRPDMGVWQTEIVFHRNYYAVAQIYPTVLYWGLTHDWSYPDRYKLMLFAFGSPDDPGAFGYGKCMLAGKTLTPHGKALETLAGLFGGEEIEPYDGVKSVPELKFTNRGDRISAFRFGNRLLVAAAFDGKTLKKHEADKIDTLKLTLSGVTADSVGSVTRVGVFGERADLSGAWRSSGGGITVDLPLKEDEANRHTDKFLKEDSLRRPALYLLVELR